MSKIRSGKKSIQKWPGAKLWSIDRIIPYERNPRTHPAEQISLLAKLIIKYGPDQPIVVDENGVVLKGHGRRLAALEAGLTQFPVVQHLGLSEADKHGMRIGDNQIALLSGWDSELMQAELIELEHLDYDLELLGFDTSTLRDFIDSNLGRNDPEEVPEPSKKPIVRTGDLWLLGHHRLLCGDCTKAEDVGHLLGTTKPHLMVTDPPYGVEYDPDWRNRADRANGKPYGARAIGRVTNDDRADWREAYELFAGDVIYAWSPPGSRQLETGSAIEAAGFEIRQEIIWVKSRLIIGRGNYHYRHEPCWYAVRRGKTSHWNGSRNQDSAWEIEHAKSETGHGTQKPIECMKRPIENNSKAGDYVYDPFLGSGTTMIAAEMKSRRCLGIDIDPVYCQVAIERWQKFTGKVATLDGVPFDQIVRARRTGKPKGNSETKVPPSPAGLSRRKSSKIRPPNSG